jgi:glucosamine 6-phosphate synthetase-like amidotransferase/phosphosugar isomerase protein
LFDLGISIRMCGIIGILGRAPVAEQLVDSLKRLEYRGYDSAGVATLEGDHLDRRRAEGKLKNLEAKLRAEPLMGLSGIGQPAGPPMASRPRTTRIPMPPTTSPSFTMASSRIFANCA